MPKHYDDMTEVCFCGGGHHTRLRINLCVYGVPPPPYIKEGRRGPAGLMVRPQGGIPIATRSRFPPFPSPSRRGEEGEEEKNGRGLAPLPYWIGLGGHAPPIGGPFSLPLKPM